MPRQNWHRDASSTAFMVCGQRCFMMSEYLDPVGPGGTQEQGFRKQP
jgi:hypothetical protein